jgi:O-antigen ligase
MDEDTQVIPEKYTAILCAVLAVIPLLVIDMPHSLAYPAGVIGLVLSGIHVFKYKGPFIWAKPTAIMVGATLCLMTLSLLWSVFFEISAKQIYKMWALLPPQIVLLSLIKTLPVQHLKKYAHFIAYGFIAASVLLCFEILSGGIVFNLMRGLPVHIPADPDEFNSGAVVIALLSFSAYAIFKHHFDQAKWTALIFVPVICAVYFTESQSAQLCFIFAVLTWFIFPYRSALVWHALKFTLPLLVMITPFVLPYLYQHAAADLQNLSFMAQGYAGHRLELWDYISRYALQEPLHGYGVRATRMITDFDSARVFHDSNMIMHPHNFALQLWLEFGIWGACLGGVILYMITDILHKNFTTSQQRILLTSFIAALVPLSLAYSLWQGWWIGALFFVAAIVHIGARQKM